MLEELSAGSGYPPEAFRTLRLHAELDPGHGAELDRMLDGLALTPPQTTVIGLSAIASAHGFARTISWTDRRAVHPAHARAPERAQFDVAVAVERA